jgi:hypothetical protein
MKIGDHVRQGDVLLLKVEDIPRGAKRADKYDPRGVVLMEGELTGHHHRFDRDIGVTLLERGNGERFAVIDPGAPKALRHEEHTAIMFAGGKFQQGFQVEDYGEEVRQVAD